MSAAASKRIRDNAGKFVSQTAAILALLVTLAAALAVRPAQADASAKYVGVLMLNWAEVHALNHQYAWGGTGPAVYDCSGLIFAAATAAGERNWPRDTYGIAALIGSRFSITTRPQRGDLALWGPVSAPYHVELVTIWSNTTFGAQDSRTRVGWHYHYPGWRPSFYLHVNY